MLKVMDQTEANLRAALIGPDHEDISQILGDYLEEQGRDEEATLVRRGQVELDLPDGLKLKMMRIPAKGKTFWMGSPGSEPDRDDDEVQHKVEFTRDFFLGIYPVTQAQYRVVMGTNPSYFSKDGKGKGKDKVAGMNTDEFPVEQVSHDDAKAFCRKLSEKLGDVRVQTSDTWVHVSHSVHSVGGQIYRLPTEAEWEYACRGGDVLKESFPFYLKGGPSRSLSGGQIDFDGNYPYNGGSKGADLQRTARCGSTAESVNSFGLYDMHGNVWEWCEDWYGPYPRVKVQDPQGPNTGSLRVIRGGSWFNNGRICRAAYRNRIEPDNRDNDLLGFRLVMVIR